MRPAMLASAVRGSFLGALLLALLAGPRPSLAAAPQLVLQLLGGEHVRYRADEIAWISFEDAETLVVVTEDASDAYPAAAIARIDFLWEVTTAVGPQDASQLFKAFHLFQNLPNPFSNQTRIDFELPQAGQVELTIYAPNGRRVRTLASGARPPGRETVVWDGLDDAGRRVASGIYLYRLRAPGIKEHRQMILLH